MANSNRQRVATSGSTKRRLADRILPEGLEPFVISRRRRGMSWRSIATEVSLTTGGDLRISDETLRGWFADADAAA